MADRKRPDLGDNRCCIVCGEDNPTGFHIDFNTEAEGIAVASWTPTARFEGFRGVVHGGMLATVLDEAMAKAVLSTGIKALTGELRVRFLDYARPEEELCIRGWITERQRRLIRAEASLLRADGCECCHAWGTFLTI